MRCSLILTDDQQGSIEAYFDQHNLLWSDFEGWMDDQLLWLVDETYTFHLPGKHNQKDHAGGSGGSRLTKTDQRAFNGKQVAIETKMSKQQAGALGEALVIDYLHSQGYEDAAPLNSELPNFAVDLVQDHEVIEVKTGMASNSAAAQQWRMTIGEPGKAEKAWLQSASPAEKAAWNSRKNEMIKERKQAAMDKISEAVGHPVKGRTMTTILNPDTKTIDLYSFEGFHQRIGWNSQQAKDGYIGSFTYTD
jgi:hypothetical protein